MASVGGEVVVDGEVDVGVVVVGKVSETMGNVVGSAPKWSRRERTKKGSSAGFLWAFIWSRKPLKEAPKSSGLIAMRGPLSVGVVARFDSIRVAGSPRGAERCSRRRARGFAPVESSGHMRCGRPHAGRR